MRMYGVVARNQAQLDGFIFFFKNCLITFQNSLCPIKFHFDYFLILFLDPRISIDQMFFNSGLFPSPSALLKYLCSLFSIKIGLFFFRFFPYKCLKLLPNFPCFTVIQGPTFIIFARFSTPNVYFLLYIYSGV